jgi:hypothetical protein
VIDVGIGFSVSPYFREKYKLELNDMNFLLFVANSPERIKLGDKGRHIFWSGTFTGQWVGGDPEIPDAKSMYHVGMVRDFVAYEDLSLAVIRRLIAEQPLQTLRLFLFDKPLLFARHAVNALVPASND